MNFKGVEWVAYEDWFQYLQDTAPESLVKECVSRIRWQRECDAKTIREVKDEITRLREANGLPF